MNDACIMFDLSTKICSFSYAKQKNVASTKAAPGGAGDLWKCTALDADSKLKNPYFPGDLKRVLSRPTGS